MKLKRNNPLIKFLRFFTGDYDEYSSTDLVVSILVSGMLILGYGSIWTYSYFLGQEIYTNPDLSNYLISGIVLFNLIFILPLIGIFWKIPKFRISVI